MLRAEGSSAEVGSSRIKICTGSPKTCASASFCFMPVEYVLTFLSEVELHDPLGDRHGAIEPDSVTQVRKHLERARSRSSTRTSAARREDTKPAAARRGSAASSRNLPTLALPDVGRSSPSRSRIVVVFPDPFGPSNP